MANGLLNGIGNSYHETLDTLRIATKINACVKVQLSLACLQRLLSVREIRQLLVTSPPVNFDHLNQKSQTTIVRTLVGIKFSSQGGFR